MPTDTGKINPKDHQWVYHLYAQSPIAIAVYIGENHIIEFANPKMCLFWGRTFDQIANKPLFQALPEVSRQGFEEILERVLVTGEPFKGNELPATLERNGKLDLAYFSLTYEPLRDENETIYGIVQTAVEVTDLVNARDRAERKEEILKLALESGKMGTWHLDYVQDKLTRSLEHDMVFGYKEMVEDWKPFTFFDHVHPEDREYALSNYQESLKTGMLKYEVRVIGPDQITRWIQVSGKVTFNLAGSPIYTSGIVSEITEQKETVQREKQFLIEQAAKKEAEKQQKVLHALFMDAPALICTLMGPDHVYELVNTMYQQLFKGRELVAKKIVEALPELAGQPIVDILGNVYRTGEEFIGNEVPLLFDLENTGEMKTLYFNFVYQAMRNEKREIVGVLVFAIDVSDQIKARKRLEESEDGLKIALNELEIKNKQLTRTNQDLDNFIYTASHDLKAPISNIEGLLEALLPELPQKGEARDLTKMMGQSVDQFKKTIKDLTEITYLQNEEEQGLQLIAFEEMLREVEVSIRGLILQSEAKIQTDFHVKEIHYYRKNLRSILYNLISNAIKYASRERKPEIVITTSQEGDYTLLCVKDNGIGMNVKNKDKIFSMFSRLHDHVEGTGVGLYIVKRMVENAEGKIEVESELGKGSALKVYFKS